MVAGCTGLGRALRVANSECCQRARVVNDKSNFLGVLSFIIDKSTIFAVVINYVRYGDIG